MPITDTSGIIQSLDKMMGSEKTFYTNHEYCVVTLHVTKHLAHEIRQNRFKNIPFILSS